MQVRMRRPNGCQKGGQKEKRENKKEAMFEEKMGEDIPELMKGTDSHI